VQLLIEIIIREVLISLSKRRYLKSITILGNSLKKLRTLRAPGQILERLRNELQ
jgi:ribosome recycling factor